MNVPEEPERAAPPSPAEAGSAAQTGQQKEAERRDVERAAAVGRLLRAGKSPEEIAGKLGETLEFVLERKRLRDLNPFRKAAR